MYRLAVDSGFSPAHSCPPSANRGGVGCAEHCLSCAKDGGALSQISEISELNRGCAFRWGEEVGQDVPIVIMCPLALDPPPTGQFGRLLVALQCSGFVNNHCVLLVAWAVLRNPYSTFHSPPKLD